MSAGGNMQRQIGQRIKKLREAKGLKQKDLAGLLDISISAYAKLEAGDRGLSSEDCILLADYFRTSCNYILMGVDAEFLDVCSKTNLTQKTLDFMIADKKEWFEYYEKSKKLNSEARKCEDEFAELEELEKGKGGELLKRADELDDDAKENWKRYCQIAERNFVINALLRDKEFLKALEFAGYRAGNEVVTQLYIEDTRKDGELLSEEMEEVSAGIDAAQFAVMRAFNRFFERICYNVDFLKVARDIPEDMIERALERNVLHYDD